MTHRKHTETTELLRRVEHYWGETRRHLRVQADLDTRLDLVLRLDERVEELVCVDDGFAVVGHQTDERGVPLVHDLGERRRTRAHEHLSDTVVELLNTCILH